MTARLIDGRAFAEGVRSKVSQLASQFEQKAGRKAGLAVVLVGADPASEVYVRSKGKATAAAGMANFEHILPETTTQTDLLDLVARLNADDQVDGILVQLPLPEGLDEQQIISAIDPDKDVDGFHVVNAGRLATGLPGIVPCTPLGCMMLLKHELGRDDFSGLEAVVIGRSNIVGKPLAQLLTAANATVTLAHSRTANLAEVARRGDILVAAVGRPQMVKADWIKPGATVIDVGINRIEGADGKARLVGDVDFGAAKEVASAITPVPGGVGPMTIALLLHNTIHSAYRREGMALAEKAI